MGIPGLLPFLEGAKRQAHVSEFRGERVAVDGYVWLHRGARRCATELATGEETTAFTLFALEMVRMLRFHGVEPVLVFDGAYFPCKAPTEQHRHASRTARRSHAEYLRCSGASEQETADAFYKALDITPEMAFALIRALREVGVCYYVAPYEADAQLAHLCLSGAVHAVVTEDSDLLAYHCPRVLYKLDRSGNAELYEFDALRRVRSAGPGSARLFEPWERWEAGLFTEMCVLSGCDYLPSASGMGVRTAHRMCAQFGSASDVLRVLRSRGALGGSADEISLYARRFRTSRLIFTHAPVYDAATRTIVHLRDALERAGLVPAGALGRAPPSAAELSAAVPLPAWPAELVQRVCVEGSVSALTLAPFEQRPAPGSAVPAARQPHSSATVAEVGELSRRSEDGEHEGAPPAPAGAAGARAPIRSAAHLLGSRWPLRAAAPSAARGAGSGVVGGLASTAAARAGFVNPVRLAAAKRGQPDAEVCDTQLCTGVSRGPPSARPSPGREPPRASLAGAAIAASHPGRRAGVAVGSGKENGAGGDVPDEATVLVPGTPSPPTPASASPLGEANDSRSPLPRPLAPAPSLAEGKGGAAGEECSPLIKLAPAPGQGPDPASRRGAAPAPPLARSAASLGSRDDSSAHSALGPAAASAAPPPPPPAYGPKLTWPSGSSKRQRTA